MTKKRIIGRKEKANFPELALESIDVKIDTGAYTSSIHCIDIKEIENRLYCKFLDESHPDYNHMELVFDNYEIASIKSSNGMTEVRYQIFTKIKFGEESYEIELTLTDRAEMKYPVLIGRKFLKGKFIVDVAKTNKLKKRQKNHEEKNENGHFV